MQEDFGGRSRNGADRTLFDDPHDLRQPAINSAAFAGAAVHELDSHSSVVHIPGLITGHDELLHQLSTLTEWEQRRRWMYNRTVDEPRLTLEYRDFVAVPAFIAQIAGELGAYCGLVFDKVWMNWYRDHRDSTGWHADRPANVPATATVPVLSLGSTRRFLLRPDGGGRSTTFIPAGGDVLIMTGRCQRDWQHSVPKQQTPAGPRMSVNFSSSAQVAVSAPD